LFAYAALVADDPTHRRIVAQAFGVIHVLVSGKPTKHRLPQHPDQIMAAILAGASVSEHLTRHRGQPERCRVKKVSRSRK
jgi:hypothetical protein